MNLLQIVQQASAELGLGNSVTAVATSSDLAIQQFYALVNRLGTDLVRQFDWEKLDTEALITTVAYNTTGNVSANSTVITGIPSTAGYSTNFGVSGNGIPPFATIVSVDSPTQITINQPATETFPGTALVVAQVAYPLPADWNRQIPQTEWDRGNRWPLNGPKSPQEWQNFKSGIVYAGPRLRFRIQGGSIQINPPPSASGTLAYEYISKNWVTSQSGTPQSSYLADTDTAIFDDSLLICGLKAKWLQAKGLDYQFAVAEFNSLLDTVKAQDKSAPKLSLAPMYSSILLSNANIPDGSWTGT